MPTLKAEERVLLYDEKFYRNKNLFIEAGAGAGKTETLKTKVLDQLLQGIKPENFVVITFTKKATEEMKGRIAGLLNDERKNTSRPENELKILQEAYENIDKMQISTIHSFCNRILTEYCFDANLSYSPNMLEEDQDEARKLALFYEWKKTLKDDEIYSFNEKNITKKIKDSYLELTNLFENANVYSYVTTISRDEAISLINETYSLLEKNVKIINPDSKAFEFYQAVSKLVPNVHLCEDDEISDLLELYGQKPKGLNDKFENDKYVTYAKKAKEYKDSFKRRYVEEINKYAIQAWNYYKENVDRENLSNNQLLNYAAELINNDSIRESLAKKIDVLYIDEFQDTDFYQIKMLSLLAEEIDKRKEKEGINTSTLFIVGDPKQSIYRFRGADINEFNKEKEKYTSPTRKEKNEFILFPDNFRSNNLIVNFVNYYFSNKEKPLGKNYQYEYMTNPDCHNIPYKEDATPKVIGGVYSYPFKVEKDEISSARNLARLVKQIKEEGFSIYKKDEKNKPYFKVEKVKYSDFLIITYTTPTLPYYVEELLKLNIPVNIQGKFSLSTSEILRINYRIINYILNPSDDSKSYAINCLNKRLDDPIKYIEDIKEKTKNMSSYGKIHYIFKNFSLNISNFNEGKKRTYMCAVEQILSTLSSSTYANDSELLIALENELNVYKENQISLSKEDDAVRIMNVHKSKGLEGNIVIIPDAGGDNPIPNKIQTHQGINYLNNISSYPEAKEAISEETKLEKRRLEYVDVTRTQQVLIFDEQFATKRLFGGEQFSNESLREFQLPNSYIPSKFNVDKLYETEEKIKTYNVTNKIEQFDLSKIKKPKITFTSPSALENKSNIEEIESNRTILRPTNNIFGNCLHRAMQLYVLSKGKEDIKKISSNVINEMILDIPNDELERYSSSLTDCIASIAQYFEKIKLFDNESLNPEFKFISNKTIEDQKVILTGSIDLLILSKDSAIIYDYKSDFAGFNDVESFEKHLKETYSPELDAYKDVVHDLFKIDTKNISTNIIWVEEKEKGEQVTHFFEL